MAMGSIKGASQVEVPKGAAGLVMGRAHALPEVGDHDVLYNEHPGGILEEPRGHFLRGCCCCVRVLPLRVYTPLKTKKDPPAINYITFLPALISECLKPDTILYIRIKYQLTCISRLWK